MKIYYINFMMYTSFIVSVSILDRNIDLLPEQDLPIPTTDLAIYLGIVLAILGLGLLVKKARSGCSITLTSVTVKVNGINRIAVVDASDTRGGYLKLLYMFNNQVKSTLAKQTVDGVTRVITVVYQPNFVVTEAHIQAMNDRPDLTYHPWILVNTAVFPIPKHIVWVALIYLLKLEVYKVVLTNDNGTHAIPPLIVRVDPLITKRDGFIGIDAMWFSTHCIAIACE